MKLYLNAAEMTARVSNKPNISVSFQCYACFKHLNVKNIITLYIKYLLFFKKFTDKKSILSFSKKSMLLFDYTSSVDRKGLIVE